MKRVHATVALAAILGFAALGFGHKDCESHAKDTTARLEALKALAGDWLEVDEHGKATSNVLSRIKVTAGGSAVMETLFPGTDHEMITVYHMDGEDLVLTHYCVMGNQPRMKLKKGTPSDVFEFQCDGVGNAKSEDEAHMHKGFLKIVGPNRLQERWHKYEGGKDTYVAEFDMVRKASEKQAAR